MNMELVHWIDSIRHDHGWQSLDHYARESEKSLECETVGFVIHERDDSIVVASSRMLGEGGCVTEVIQIPLSAVRERVILSKSRKQG